MNGNNKSYIYNCFIDTVVRHGLADDLCNCLPSAWVRELLENNALEAYESAINRAIASIENREPLGLSVFFNGRHEVLLSDSEINAIAIETLRSKKVIAIGFFEMLKTYEQTYSAEYRDAFLGQIKDGTEE